MTAALSPFTTSMRPWLTSGVALVGVGAIALAPITPSLPTVTVPNAVHTISAEAQLAAIDWPYVLSLPILRQWLTNRVQVWTVWLGGFVQAGVGLVESLLTIPGVTVEVIQQLFALDFVGAFETVTGAIRDGVVATIQPLVDSWVLRNGAVGAVSEALATAIPQALIAEVNGFLNAANVVTVSLIAGVQGVVGALLPIDLGALIDATLLGTRNFVIALGDGAESIIGGIAEAQKLIATALAARPDPVGSVTDISVLRDPIGEAAAGVAKPFKTFTLDTASARKQTIVTGAVVDAPTKAELPDASEVVAGSEISPPADIADEVKAPEKPARVNPIKDLVTRVEDSVEKVADHVKAEQNKTETAIKKVTDRIKAKADDAARPSFKKRVSVDAG